MAVGGERYCLVFVDRATRYNWVLALKTLGTTDICDAFNLFCAKAGSFAKTICANCDAKLLGKTTNAYLTKHSNTSNIVGTADG